MSHKCHVNNCTTPVAPRLLMCRKHWEIVPADLKARVLNTFNPQQCSGRVRPSTEWLKAAREALNYVAKATGNWHEPAPQSQSTAGEGGENG